MTANGGRSPGTVPLDIGRSTSSRPRGWAYAGLLLVVSAVGSLPMIGPTFGGYFQSDDFEMIWRATRFDPAMPSLGYPSNHWRPLVELSLRLNHSIGGLDPVGYRAANAVIHAATAATVGALVGLLTPLIEHRSPQRRDRWASVVAVAAFALWPSHGEAVLWVAGRGDLLMTLFGLWAVAAAVASAAGDLQRSPSAMWAGRRAPGLMVVASLCLALALLSKESAVAIPFISTVLVVMSRRSATPSVGPGALLVGALRTTLPLYLVAVAWLAWRRFALGSFAGGFAPVLESSSAVTVTRGSLALVLRSFLPAMSAATWLVAAAGIVLLAGYLFAQRRTIARHAGVGAAVAPVGSALGTSLAYFACAALAVLPVMALGASLTDSAGERLAYLPSAFVVAALARWWTVLMCRHQRVAVATASGLIAVLVVISTQVGFRWASAALESQRLAEALGVLPPDEPALVLGARERDEHGIPVALNAMGATVVLLHGWTDPTLISDSQDWPLPAGQVPTVWDFDGSQLRPRPR